MTFSLNAAIKVRSLGLAAYLKEKATAAGNTVSDPAARQQTLSRLKYWGTGCASSQDTELTSQYQYLGLSKLMSAKILLNTYFNAA